METVTRPRQARVLVTQVARTSSRPAWRVDHVAFQRTAAWAARARASRPPRPRPARGGGGRGGRGARRVAGPRGAGGAPRPAIAPAPRFPPPLVDVHPRDARVRGGDGEGAVDGRGRGALAGGERR